MPTQRKDINAAEPSPSLICRRGYVTQEVADGVRVGRRVYIQPTNQQTGTETLDTDWGILSGVAGLHNCVWLERLGFQTRATNSQQANHQAIAVPVFPRFSTSFEIQAKFLLRAL